MALSIRQPWAWHVLNSGKDIEIRDWPTCFRGSLLSALLARGVNMGDTMLHGVLRMPPELWSDDTLDEMQRYQRYLQASRRIEEQEHEIDRLRSAMLTNASMLERDGDEFGIGAALRRASVPNE